MAFGFDSSETNTTLFLSAPRAVRTNTCGPTTAAPRTAAVFTNVRRSMTMLILLVRVLVDPRPRALGAPRDRSCSCPPAAARPRGTRAADADTRGRGPAPMPSPLPRSGRRQAAPPRMPREPVPSARDPRGARRLAGYRGG